MSGTGVVVPVHGRHDHLALLLASLRAGTVAPDVVVVVAMDDDLADLADTPLEQRAGCPVVVADQPVPAGGLPLAAARNTGVRVAEEHDVDVLVLLDVDLLAGPDLVEAYTAAVQDDDEVVWSGPVTYLDPPPPGGYDLGALAALDDPHPARPAPPPGARVRDADPDLFWSLSFALSPAAWHRVGGFCEDYVGYGGEDTDFARLVASAGLSMGWDGSARGYHQHHPTSSPPVQHLHDIVRNGRLFHRRWGEWPMQGWLDAFVADGLLEQHDGDYLVTGDLLTGS